MSGKELIYAHPVSQPARAVVWLCKLNHHDGFEYKTVNVTKGETRTEEFKTSLNPMGKIPVLRDGNFILTESHAIMIYLAEKHGWDQWYPKDPQIRARMHEYMNWHHHNARRASEIFVNILMTKLGRSTPAMEASLKAKDRTIAVTLRMLEHWLAGSEPYIAGTKQPTIADMSCYNELVQLEVLGLLKGVSAKFPKVAAWMSRMKQLPHHDEQLAPMMKFFHKFQLIPATL